MTIPSVPPTPENDWKQWALSLRDYLLKERAQVTKTAPMAPQIAHRIYGESASQDGLLMFNPGDTELEVSIGGAWTNLLRSGTATLDDLSDVIVTTPATGQVVRYNGTNWVNARTLLDDLSDVVITTPATNHALIYNGTNWANTILNLDALSDVAITTPASGQLVRYNGTAWVNAASSTVFNFNDTTNFIATETDGQIGDATALIKNSSGGTNDFVQIMFSLNSGNTLVARIVAIQTASTTSELSFITEIAGVVGERFRIDAAGTPTVSGGRFKITTSSPPATATSTGTVGEIAWDANYIYVCTAANTWKRVAIATW